MPRSQFDALQTAAYRGRVLKGAFAVGSALWQYAANHNGAFPATDADLATILAAYLNNAQIPAGFVYTFAGGKPADKFAILGYPPDEKGRTVVTAGGDVTLQQP